MSSSSTGPRQLAHRRRRRTPSGQFIQSCGAVFAAAGLYVGSTVSDRVGFAALIIGAACGFSVGVLLGVAAVIARRAARGQNVRGLPAVRPPAAPVSSHGPAVFDHGRGGGRSDTDRRLTERARSAEQRRARRGRRPAA